MDYDQISPGQQYMHFKHGTLYEVVCVARHTEDEVDLVVYFDVRTKRFFARPIAMFVESIERDGKVVKRFSLVSTQK